MQELEDLHEDYRNRARIVNSDTAIIKGRGGYWDYCDFDLSGRPLVQGRRCQALSLRYFQMEGRRSDTFYLWGNRGQDPSAAEHEHPLAEGWDAILKFDRMLPNPVFPRHPSLAMRAKELLCREPLPF